MTRLELGIPVRYDDADNTCFGCSPHNDRGLQLEFVRTGPKEVECRYTAAAHFGGMPGVIHGGIQATILDEVMGVAAHCAFDHDTEVWMATVDFSLRYRRPAPTEAPILVLGELERIDGRNVHVRGEIRDLGGKTLTTATARWRVIDRRD
jgi:acyl-coenzyme A thioesterase PaaI-like protein